MNNWKMTGFEPSLALSYLICKAYPNEHVSALIFGEKRIGKSVYALKVMQQVFEAFGMSEEDAWQRSLDSMYFNIDEFFYRLKELTETEEVYPVLCVDDAGIGLSAHKWFTDRKGAQVFKSVLDTIGTIVSGLLVTTPEVVAVLKSVRDTNAYRVKITKGGGGSEGQTGWMRNALGYGTVTIPTGQVWVSKQRGFVDDYSAHLSDDHYEQYRRKRLGYTTATIDQAIAQLGERVEGEPEHPAQVSTENSAQLFCDLCKRPAQTLYEVYEGDRRYMVCEECYQK